MGDFARISITGADELKARLDALGEALKEKGLRSATYAGAAVICEKAIENAPYYTGDVALGHPPPGTLKASIIVKRIEEQSGPYRQTYFVTVRKSKKGDAYYAHWVEYGHWINRTGKSMRNMGTPKRMRARAAAADFGPQKYVPAQPYMRPAFEAMRETAIQRIQQRLGEYLSGAVK